jgi:hypothetical protein
MMKAIRPSAVRTGALSGLQKRFEAAPLALRAGNVVSLHGHRIRDAPLEDPLERSAQVANAARGGVVGVVRKDVEDAAAEDLFPAGLRGAQVGIARRYDPQIGREDEIEARSALEQGAEAGVGDRSGAQ